MRQCSFDSCTYSITGRCIQGMPESECPHLQETDDLEEASSAPLELEESDWHRPEGIEDAAGHAVLQPAEEMPRLPSSMTLGRAEAQELMCSEATTMVGIVGLPGSGKTACLVSAYLLLSRGTFRGYSYADSRSLMALEQISRGSRQWAAVEQRQLTVRTELADDRLAGFLHFKLRRTADGRLLNVLLPDLPGEWSSSLIDKADSERFEFIKSAAVIWIMVDGRDFADTKKRNYAIHRTELLITRLAEIVTPSSTRLILVPSWKDIGEFPQTAFDQVQAEAASHGFSLIFSPVASFSQNNLVPPGEGVAELLNITLNHSRECPAFWPDNQRGGHRKLAGFRSLEWN